MITIQDLGFRYNASQVLFQKLRLQCEPGNIYGLLGRNGSGKTTLLKLIAGLLFPIKGTCTVDGLHSRDRLPKHLSQTYFVPEEFYVPPVTAERYLDLYAPFYPDFDSKMFYDALEQLELPKDKLLTQLSYGQKKKTLIAFGVATNAKLLILDEPTNGLDIPAKSKMRKLLTSALTDEKLFIISTHQVRDLEHLIDPIIILDEGEILFQQSTQAISERLALIHQNTPPNKDEALYWEETLGKYHVIMENKEQLDTHIELEMLFNAIIQNKEKIQTLFPQDDRS